MVHPNSNEKLAATSRLSADRQSIIRKDVDQGLTKRRVLIYAMNYSPEIIGCGRYTGELGNMLDTLGWGVEVVTTPPHYPGWKIRNPEIGNRYTVCSEARQKVFRCPLYLPQKMSGLGRVLAPLSWAIASAPVAIWRILKFKPQFLYCVEPTLLAAPMVLAVAKALGVKAILHVQDLELEAAFAVGHVKGRGLKKLVDWFDATTTRQFDCVVTISHKMRERLISKRVRADKITLVRNWVNCDAIYPLGRPSIFRAELGLAEDVKIALYTGNIGTKQALDVIIDVAQEFSERSDVKFVIAGEGPAKEGLMERAGSNVLFLPLQPEDKLNDLLNLADIHLLPQLAGVADLVLPSKIGGMLASGKPILAMADEGTEVRNFLSGVAQFSKQGDVQGAVRLLREVFQADSIENTDSNEMRALRLREITSDGVVEKIFASG